MKITGIARSAEEIMGVYGLKYFGGIKGGKVYSYTQDMNALAGQRIELTVYEGANGYDYTSKDYDWLSVWLKDIKEEKEEVDWSKVPVDTKVRIEKARNRHFAKFETSISFPDGRVWTWRDGMTSWSDEGENNLVSWPPDQVELAED